MRQENFVNLNAALDQPSPGDFAEEHVFGKDDRLWAVRVSAHDARPFIATAPVCGALSRYRIAHAGVHDASFPYSVVRTNLSGTFSWRASAVKGACSPTASGNASQPALRFSFCLTC